MHSHASPALVHFKLIRYKKIWIYKPEGASLQKNIPLLHVFDSWAFLSALKTLSRKKSYAHINKMPVCERRNICIWIMYIIFEVICETKLFAEFYTTTECYFPKHSCSF